MIKNLVFNFLSKKKNLNREHNELDGATHQMKTETEKVKIKIAYNFQTVGKCHLIVVKDYVGTPKLSQTFPKNPRKNHFTAIHLLSIQHLSTS